MTPSNKKSARRLPIKSPRKSIKSPRKSPGKRKTPQPSPQTETTDLAKVCVSHDTSKATLPELLYGDDPSLQEYYLSRHRKAYFDHAFIEETKTIQESGKLDNRSTKTKQDLQHIVDVVTHWNTTAKYEKDGSLLPKELKEFREFKKNNKAGFKWRQYYNIEKILLPGDNEETIVIRRMEVKNKQKYVGRIIVSQEDSFDRIQEHHRMSGHLGAESTYNNCNLKYFNITQAMVRTFCKTCPTCLEKNPILPPHVGAQKVIYSHQWRDRFQVDLIDMRKFARPNVYGVVQNWIMTVKDHFSGFTALFSIPQKKAEYVAHELEKYFGLVGYPTIFQTDNGNEFVARQLLDMIAEINPAIITVTGRPRTPRDQGSVERANQTVKRILADVCAERRKDGKDDNWTKFLGMITAQLNTHHTRQANSVSPYRTVFGSDYHLLTKTSLSDTRKCNTIGELKDLVIDDGHLEHYVAKYYSNPDDKLSTEDEQRLIQQCNNYWIDDAEDEKQQSALSPDAEDEKQQAEDEKQHAALSPGDVVTQDNIILCGVIQNPDIDEILGESFQLSSFASNDSVQQSPHTPDPVQKNTTSTFVLPTPGSSSSTSTNESTPSKQDVSTIATSAVTPGVQEAVTILTELCEVEQTLMKLNFRIIKTVEDAWKYPKMIKSFGKANNDSKKYTAILARLSCDLCCHNGQYSVLSYDPTYITWHVNGSMWFDTEFINQFSIMLQHTAHQTASLVKTPQLVMCDFEGNSVEVVQVVGEEIVAVLCDGSHYAVMSGVLSGRVITVYDGFASTTSAEKWVKYVTRVLQRVGIVSFDDKGMSANNVFISAQY